jgi:hypothetical protein
MIRSKKAYFKYINGIVREIKQEVKDTGQDPFDLAHEWVVTEDSLEDPISCMYILIHSNNRNALFEFGTTATAQSFEQIMNNLAYAAMYQDISMRLR